MKNSWAAGLTQMRGGETGKHEAASPITPTDRAVTGPNWRVHISFNRIPRLFALSFKEKSRVSEKSGSSCGNNDITRGYGLHGQNEPATLTDTIVRLLVLASSLSAQRRCSGEIGRPLSFTPSLDEG